MKNFKVRCINQDISDCFVTGDIYEVINGVIMDKNNTPYNPNNPIFTVEEFNKNCFPHFELVDEMSFTKADIKDGMILTYRNGCKRIVIDKKFYSYPEIKISGNSLNNYNDDLTLKNTRCEDIMKVSYDGKVIWERKECFYTLDEAICIASEEYKNIKHKDLNEIYNPCCITDVLKLIKMVLDNKPDVDLFEMKEFEVVDWE